tara:strand:- start:457 stop:645 length:189 start_codon:yes stop_codon:yes gene_type:complete
MKNKTPYVVKDILEDVLDTVVKTRNTSLDLKAHAAKMILYRDYNIDVSITTLRRRLKLRGEV